MAVNIPPVPPKRPVPPRPVINNTAAVGKTEMNNVDVKQDTQDAQNEEQNKKGRLKLNSQTKDFIIYATGGLCFVIAIICFVFMFI